jgi:phage terminase small subunit
MSQDEKNDTPIELSPDDKAMLAAYFKNNMIGTRAWMATHPKASYESAAVSASEWLKKPNIKAAIDQFLDDNLMGEKETMWRMGAIAKADLLPFICTGEDGFVYFDLSDPQAMEFNFLIKEMETKRERRIEGKGKDAETWEGEWVRVKLHDAYAALRDIAKMHGKLSERHEVTGAGGKDLIPPEIIEVVRTIIKDKDD